MSKTAPHTRRAFVSAIAALPIAAVIPTAAPSIASGLPTQADAELVRAAQDLAAIDQAFEDLYCKYGRDADFSPLGVRRNENIATLVTIQAKSAAGIQAKATSLRLRAMIADQDQHQQIAVSLADDLVGGIPLAALAAAAPAHAAAAVDPIFAMIEAHRKARAASCAASAEVKRLCELADEIAGPREIDVPSMIEAGTTVKASIWLDIERAIPCAQFPKQYAHYLALLEERRAARFAVTGDTDPIGEDQYAAEWDATDEFAETVPTTLAGLLAMIIYAAECSDGNPDAFTDHSCPLIESLATAAMAIGGRA